MLSNIDFGSYFHTKKYEKGLSTGGDKIADWGDSKGGWGGHVPPSLYVKRGPGSITQRIYTVHYLYQRRMKINKTLRLFSTHRKNSSQRACECLRVTRSELASNSQRACEHSQRS